MGTKTAVVTQVRGITFAGKADSNHWVMMDGPHEFGGSAAATRPKELVLLALGGCTGSDVVTILRKKRVAVDGLEINLSADEAEEHPKRYTRIHVEYVRLRPRHRGSRRRASDRAVREQSTAR